MLVYLVWDRSMDQLLREEQVNIMLTFASIPKGRDIPRGFKSVLLDSGGYQLQTGVDTGRALTPSSYAAWLQFNLERFPEIVGYFNMDILGNTDQTLSNQLYLESQGLHPIPVWHPGEDDAILDYYVSKHEYVALGGLVGKGKMDRHVVRKVFERMITKYKSTRFHIFGMGITASSALRSFRPYSVDYSTWINSYRYGMGLVWDKDGLLREKLLPEDIRARIRVDK